MYIIMYFVVSYLYNHNYCSYSWHAEFSEPLYIQLILIEECIAIYTLITYINIPWCTHGTHTCTHLLESQGLLNHLPKLTPAPTAAQLSVYSHDLYCVQSPEDY